MWTKQNIPDLTGKIAIVTGSNTGIGYEMAKALYEAGAHVTIAARSSEKAKAAMEAIEATTSGKGKITIGILNLASLEAVKVFADTFKSDHQQLDILINNAGVMIPPPSRTEEGFELQFGVNFLGHYALTGHLMPLLNQSVGSRVVTVSSGAAIHAAGIDFENLKLEKPYDAWREYAVSKLANILFAYEFNRKLQSINSGIISMAVHPGVTRTDLQRNIPQAELERLLKQFNVVMEAWQGALPALFAATDPSAVGGAFYAPNGENEYSGYPALSQYNTPAMHDKVLAEKLWSYAATVTGVNYPATAI